MSEAAIPARSPAKRGRSPGKKMGIARNLEAEATAARDLLAELGAAVAEDGELAADMVEGSTDFFEALDAALGRLDTLAGLRAGTKAAREKLGVRDGRLERQAERIEAAIDRAVQVSGLGKIERPGATVGRARLPRQTIYADESKVPARFWVTPDPPPKRIDRAAVTAALRAGEAVDGAMLDNGGWRLAISRK